MTPQLGITWSHQQAEWLELDPWRGLETCCQWPIAFVRIGVHWSHVASQPNTFDWDHIHKQLDVCKRFGQSVVLTIGAKAPRWPEFFVPDFVDATLQSEQTRESLLRFIEAAVIQFRSNSAVTHWQVENEPLDPSGPNNQVIPRELLEQEVDLVRRLDDRPIIVNLWGNDLGGRGLLPAAATLADIIGLDLYPKQFAFRLFNQNFYRRPADSDEHLRSLLQGIDQPIWITELQAEPWDHDADSYRADQSPSISLQQLQQNFEWAQSFDPAVILFWGAEYWLWRAEQGDDQYLSFIENRLQSNSDPR